MRISGQVVVTEEMKYELEETFIKDQKDWNKLTGIELGLKGADNAVLIAWRYNPVCDDFHFAPYINNGSKKRLPSVWTRAVEGDIIVFGAVVKGDYYTASVYNNREEFESEDATLGNISTTTTHGEFTKRTLFDRIIAYRVQPWFGGNRKAPNDIYQNVHFD